MPRHAVLAGNSRLHVDGAGVVRVEAQLHAFREGLRWALDLLEQGQSVRVAVAMDHRGHFAEQFVAERTSVRGRRRPHLGNLLPSVGLPFEEVARAVGFPVDDVHILAEGTARLRSRHLATTAPADLLDFLFAPDDDESCPLDGGPEPTRRPTCGAIALAYYERAAEGCEQLTVFYEDAPWSRPGVVQRGAMLAERLGVAGRITVRAVRPPPGARPASPPGDAATE